MILAAGCATQPAPAHPANAPPPVVDTEAPAPVVAETLPIVETQPEVAPPEVEAEAPEAPEVAAVDEGSKDPFDSETVDNNREGKHIMKRALMMPKDDPPTK